MSASSNGAEKHPSSLGVALDRHFLACAAAATAGVVAASNGVEAAVIYSGLLDTQVNHATPTGIYIDVDSLISGAPSSAVPGWHMNIYNATFQSGSKAVRLLTPDNLASPDVTRNTDPVGFLGTGGYSYVSKLVAGTSIGSGSSFVESTPAPGTPYSYFAFNSVTTGYDVSPWNGGATNGFMGFQFTSGGSTHYGWARLNIEKFSDPSRPFGVTLRDFAYEDVAGQAITAGAGIPEPAGLALAMLALGAVGIRPTRKPTNG
jgi:hypothetical protein